MSINPQTISDLLSLCPICPDIQFKILMLFIGDNGTPSFFAIKDTIDNMKMYYIKFQLKYASEQTLTYCCTDLSLFKYMNIVYPSYSLYEDEYDEDDDEDDEEEYDHEDPANVSQDGPKQFLPDFLYEIQIAYTLYHHAQEGLNRIKDEYNESKKIKLNKMIEEGKPYNI
jgi:hypothetical protein